MKVGHIRLVGYVRLGQPRTRWGTRHVRLVGYVRSGLTVMVLEPDPGSDKSDTSDVSEIGSDISDREAVP
jgi:hypothetical protein